MPLRKSLILDMPNKKASKTTAPKPDLPKAPLPNEIKEIIFALAEGKKLSHEQMTQWITFQIKGGLKLS